MPRKRRRRHFDAVVEHAHRRAHRAQHVDEGDVALHAVAADAAYRDRPPRIAAGREKVRGRRRVAFDEDRTRRTIVSGRNVEAPIAIVVSR